MLPGLARSLNAWTTAFAAASVAARLIAASAGGAAPARGPAGPARRGGGGARPRLPRAVDQPVAYLGDRLGDRAPGVAAARQRPGHAASRSASAAAADGTNRGSYACVSITRSVPQ